MGILSMTSQERYAAHSQLEHLQAKYVGTGHADTTKFEWAVNQHRDSYALYCGVDSLSSFFAVAENESVGRVKFSCLQKMIQPCGPLHRRRRTETPAVGFTLYIVAPWRVIIQGPWL